MQFTSILCSALLFLGAAAQNFEARSGVEANEYHQMAVRSALAEAHDIAMRSGDGDIFMREVRSIPQNRGGVQRLTVDTVVGLGQAWLHHRWPRILLPWKVLYFEPLLPPQRLCLRLAGFKMWCLLYRSKGKWRRLGMGLELGKFV